MTTSLPIARLGGCQCGALRYAVLGKPIALYACHCRECQKQSASAFGMTLSVQRQDFRLTCGAAAFWSRPAASGGSTRCAFCPVCGSRVWHQADGDVEPATIGVKAGSLDIPVDFSAAIHIWTSRKLPGVIIPADARQYPQQPQ